jgi:quercetin dioxygenase-like cupin family protein
MSINSKQGQSIWRHTAMGAAIAGALSLGAAGAYAGQCPADKVVADGKGQKPSTAAAKDVTDTVLRTIDLSREKVAVQGRQFRLRRLEIKPGGIVPWHSHGDRPAQIYVVSGVVTEYSSTCAVPIVHKAGEASAESVGTSHWWQNTGKETVVLIAADLFPVTEMKTERMM